LRRISGLVTHAQDRGLEGDLQVVLDHHGEATELLVIAICVDRGLFDQRVQFLGAQFRHEGKRTRRALPVQAARCPDSVQA
jgi:asparagine synthetase A